MITSKGVQLRHPAESLVDWLAYKACNLIADQRAGQGPFCADNRPGAVKYRKPKRRR